MSLTSPAPSSHFQRPICSGMVPGLQAVSLWRIVPHKLRHSANVASHNLHQTGAFSRMQIYLKICRVIITNLQRRPKEIHIVYALLSTSRPQGVSLDGNDILFSNFHHCYGVLGMKYLVASCKGMLLLYEPLLIQKAQRGVNVGSPTTNHPLQLLSLCTY